MNSLNNREVYIRFFHPEIEVISDGSLRKILREFSKMTNELLLDEIDLILSNMELPYRQKQSIRDQTKNEFSGKANFYLEKIEKGSLELLVVLGAASIYILKETLGKSLGKAWEKSDMGQAVENQMQAAFNSLYRYMKRRPAIVIKELAPQFRRRVLGDRYIVKSVRRDKGKSNNIVIVEIGNVKKPRKQIDIHRYDNRFVEEELAQEIKKQAERKRTHTRKKP